MIFIAPGIEIDESCLKFAFVRSSGPGGQNVNKVSTAVQLHFDVANCPSLPEAVRQRLTKLTGSRLSAKGVLSIDARRHRSQARNREEAVQRLVELLRRAAQRPKVRRATRPTAASHQRRRQSKTLRTQRKRSRGAVSED